jgi:transcriptional regulator with XRE-family HTH domain
MLNILNINVMAQMNLAQIGCELHIKRIQVGLLQEHVARFAGLSRVTINQLENGTLKDLGESQPAVDVLKRLAIALSVNADTLLFDESEGGADEDLRLQFEALSAMSPEEKQVAKAVLEAMIVKNQVTGAVAGALARAAPQAAKKEKAAARK